MNPDKHSCVRDPFSIWARPHSSAVASNVRCFAYFVLWRVCAGVILSAVCLTAATAALAQNLTESHALPRACDFLWSQQSDDGGWHSKQYAVLRSGQALTPFVLHALLSVPESVYPRPQERVDKALHFIRRHVDRRGAIGAADPDILEYPVYSTAYALQCVLIVGRAEDFELAAKMRNFLLVAQRSELHGFEPASVAYGGWGFDWPQNGEPGHMDIAHTRRALEALAAFELRWPNVRPSAFAYSVRMRAAQDFLFLLQRHPKARAAQPRPANAKSTGSVPYDGGFYFSPIVLMANKGRGEVNDAGDAYFRSYATATCDGILAILAAGVTSGDERVQRATEWLRKHDNLTYPEGVPTDHSEPWGEAIRFYHYAVRAEAYAALDWPGDWNSRLTAAVCRHQRPDGSFCNDASPLMQEDDPLLCTALAAIALANGSRISPK
jgi:hypothetical protein